ncbi:MAG: LysR family transcriptional regulator [Planctomycetes bacterium]|nr:LysR family transcriptional regulator [Planctomycetota bacterium]
MPKQQARRAYKDVRLQQLRSFCETARLGSLAAAAAALEVSQPAVWEQVHALEREFGVRLVEPHGRGCRLTDLGRFLAEAADPLVVGIDSLKRTVQERSKAVEARLTVAAPQRILSDDLPEVVIAFTQAHPEVRLRLLERRTHEVGAAVESGEADLGLDAHAENAANPRLTCEPAYELDVLLLTPADHPLSRLRRVQPSHLRGYPLVNAPEDFSRPEIAEQLRKLGVFDAQPRRVEAATTAVVRRYVELGFGIGLVFGLPSKSQSLSLHEQSMSRYFGRGVVGLVRRRGVVLGAPAEAFAKTVRSVLTT